MIARTVKMWLDHDKLGCGWRDFVVLEGRKWATLIVVGSGEHARMTMTDPVFVLRIHKSIEIDRERTRKRLRRNAKVFGTEDATIKEALELLK